MNDQWKESVYAAQEAIRDLKQEAIDWLHAVEQERLEHHKNTCDDQGRATCQPGLPDAPEDEELRDAILDLFRSYDIGVRIFRDYP